MNNDEEKNNIPNTRAQQDCIDSQEKSPKYSLPSNRESSWIAASIFPINIYIEIEIISIPSILNRDNQYDLE